MIKSWSEQVIYGTLLSDSRENFTDLLEAADVCRKENIGSGVYLRGLIEFSNICDRNCFYCGIRKDNRNVERYRLHGDEIVALAMSAFDHGYHSIALQAGEVDDPRQIDKVADIIKEIKAKSRKLDPAGQGLGITLSIGELSFGQYRSLWEAGAHRYLLRIETSDPRLFRSIHPSGQSFARRMECLEMLKEIGYQVGTGIMIGVPGQTIEQLARDLLFFKDRDIDMLGMGPYIPHPHAPLSQKHGPDFDPLVMTVKMLAVARLMMPDINMVCSTALQTINPRGLELGLKAGANVVMPVLTPDENRAEYSLYEDKQYTEPQLLIKQIEELGYEVGLWTWGDSRHYAARNKDN